MLRAFFNLWTTRSWVWMLGGMLLAGVVHIVSVLSMPQAIEDTGWKRIMELAEDRKLKVLPNVTANAQLIPFLSTDLRYAICRFDVGEGPVVIRARLRQPSWHVALFDAKGANFYTVSGADIRREALDLVINRPGANVTPPKGLRPDAVLLEAPAEPAFAVIFAPVLGTAYRVETQAALKQSRCA